MPYLLINYVLKKMFLNVIYLRLYKENPKHLDHEVYSLFFINFLFGGKELIMKSLFRQQFYWD